MTGEGQRCRGDAGAGIAKPSPHAVVIHAIATGCRPSRFLRVRCGHGPDVRPLTEGLPLEENLASWRGFQGDGTEVSDQSG